MTRTTVEVPTETGRYAAIDITRDEHTDIYLIEVSGALIDRQPEAVTAAVQMAFLAVKSAR